MIDFTEVYLPGEFVNLLRFNSSLSGDAGQRTAKYLESVPSLKHLAKRSLEEFDPEKCRLEVIINNLGSNSFRDRMASVYYQKLKDGKFTFKSDIGLIDDVIELEERLQKHTILGMPNCFLISFYFKLLSLENKVEDEGIKSLQFYNRIEEAIELLSELKTRVVKIDWLLIQLMNLCEFIPFSELKRKLKTESYEKLYSGLSTKQKGQMLNNLLSYGYAVGDKETLIPPAEAV